MAAGDGTAAYDGIAPIEALLARARSGKNGAWPIEAERPILTNVNTWRALRDGNVEALMRIRNTQRDKRAEYRIDPLGERIAEAWAHYLAGEEPRVMPAAESDVPLLGDLLDESFASELERAAVMSVSEGEAWGRIYADREFAGLPLLEWHSRLDVFPLWVAGRLVAAALVTELEDPETDPGAAKSESRVLYRLFECHAIGIVANVLYKGTASKLGEEVSLEAHPRTRDLWPLWRHELPVALMGRIPNKLRSDPCHGISDYRGILDFLLDLNETAATGAVNARLAARKRVIVSQAAVRAQQANDLGDLGLTPEENPLGGTLPPKPVFDSAESVFVADALDTELGGGGSDPFRVLEYAFDAAGLIAWRRDLVEVALTRVGLSAQYAGLGAGQEGYAISGTALRLRLIPTDATGRGKLRYWNVGLPRLLSAMTQVDALETAKGGFGRPWSNARALPTVERRPGIPTDDLEEAQRHQALIAAGAESIETAVRELHPDWEESEVTDEVDRIRSDKAATMPSFGA